MDNLQQAPLYKPRHLWMIEWESGRCSWAAEYPNSVYSFDTLRCEAWPEDWTWIPGFLSASRVSPAGEKPPPRRL